MSIAWNEITAENSNEMTFDELLNIANRISQEMQALNIMNDESEHQLLFAFVDFSFFMTIGERDITDNGDVVYMLRLYNSMLAFSNMINNNTIAKGK